MPPPARRALIVFDDGIGIYVQSTVEEINDELGALAGARIPLIKVLDEEGAELWINADHIRAFHRGDVVALETGRTQTDFDQTKRPGRIPFGLARHDLDDPGGGGGHTGGGGGGGAGAG
jgi:hypothetical protein